ncbi:MAG: tRNA (adenosine(37)-N6)-threonylcarbamoyltransferase complex ATPase subunit type 1 TsaE [Bacteriovoracaceae bacterium]|jgi:tRNA threonylcarbamoyladenosine biosynthesis protein TsaE|nr:tRNA (adenosine(37)-N6)-threonylcarbamoyltransferase complex ATPase subunit type 1 TsaE [Bacteriovoracaceae bacterium]
MKDNELNWKKVYESDLPNIVEDVRDFVELPSVIVLSGEVGAGKTTFSKAFINQGETSSPSYSLINEIGNTAHADLYRLETSDDIVHLEIPLYLEEKEFFLVEWGKQYLSVLKKLIPDEYSYYELEISCNKTSSTDSSTSSRNYRLTTIIV